MNYFGTDGIRGRAGDSLSPELALRAAAAFAFELRCARTTGALRVVLGTDSRLSSPMLASAVASGLALGGVDVQPAGVVPTPVVPFGALKLKAAGGVMVTASHNPVPDNGLKFFDAQGFKISADAERRISATIDSSGFLRNQGLVEFGRTAPVDLHSAYLRHLARFNPRVRAGYLLPAVVLDCAYGASAELAPRAFEAAGYQVLAINASFDGRRINVKSGATDLSALAAKVRRSGAALGIAFDGDADRMLAVDETGRPVSGDKIIALFALRLARYRRQQSVVMTHMTNMGVELALAQAGVAMLRTDVGDSKVLAAMQSHGLDLGGEQSGHIIMRDRLTTGDGIASGLQLAALVAASGQTLSSLVAPFEEYPQLLTNLRVPRLNGWQSDRKLTSQLKAIQRGYPDVRFYIRASGTEPLLRVLTEARDSAVCAESNAAACAALQDWSTQ